MPKNSPSDFCGVGNHPRSLPLMWQSKSTCSNVLPFRIIPAFGQISENASKPCSGLFSRPSKEVCDVFHDDEFWSYFANQTDDFRPETASRSIDASLSPRNAKVLAGEPTRDDIDGNSISPKSVGCEFSYVMVARNLWPMLLEDAPREFLDLAEGDCFEATRALKTKAETADTAEQIEDTEFLAHAATASSGTIPGQSGIPCTQSSGGAEMRR